MLSFKDKTTTEIWTYQIQEVDTLKDIRVVFIDHKFSYCSYPMKGEYTRTGWKVLKEIEEIIETIEEGMPPLEKQNLS